MSCSHAPGAGSGRVDITASSWSPHMPSRSLCSDVTAHVQVWVVEDGHITNYNGYFEDYRDELHKEIAAELDEEERVAAERAAERAAAKAAKGGKK